MSFFPNAINAQYGDEKKTSTDKRWELGKVMVLPDGRMFRYGRASALNVVGNLYQQTLNSAEWDEIAVEAAAAIGATAVSITNGTAAIAADDFADGFLNVEDDAGEGRVYKISSNLAIAASAVGTINLYPNDPIQIALTTVTTVTLFRNPGVAVLIHQGPPTAALYGVAAAAIAASSYGWYQFKGPCSVLTSATDPILGKIAMASDTVDGAIETFTATGDDEEIVGTAMEAVATGEYALVNLNMA